MQNPYFNPLSQDNVLLKWIGILIIKEGLYSGTFLNFYINFPKNYPLSPPSVEFIEEVYHPLIDPISNQLDVNYFFKNNWLPGRNTVLLLLYKIKDIFLNPKYFFVQDSFNKEAGKLFCENYLEYEKNVMKFIKNNNNENINSENNSNNNKKSIHGYNDNYVDEELIKEFKKILKKDNMNSNTKQEQIENYFIFKYKPIS